MVGRAIQRVYWALWRRRTTWMRGSWQRHNRRWIRNHLPGFAQELAVHEVIHVEPWRPESWRKRRRGTKWFRGTREGNRVFIKTNPNPAILQNEAENLRILREAGAAVPQPLAHTEQFLVLEWLDGQTMASRSGGDADADRIAAGLVEALDALDAAGIVHRDLHRSNVLVGQSIHLLDLGRSVRPGQVDTFAPSRRLKLARWLLRLPPGRWDDAESVATMLEHLPSTPEVVRAREAVAARRGRRTWPPEASA